MKASSPRYLRSFALHHHSLFVLGVLAILVTLGTVTSLTTASSEGSRTASPHIRSVENRGAHGFERFDKLLPIERSTAVPFLFGLQETIATFAADCVTPQTAFTLGETVCAQTDSVDLNYPGGRWVHWLRQDNSIAYGGSITTQILSNPQQFTFTPDQLGSWKVTIAEAGDDSQTPAIFTVSLGPEAIATYESTCTLADNSFSVGDTVCAKADPNFTGTRFIYWVNSQGDAVQTDVITSTNPTASRQMNVAGNWWVYFSDSDGSLRNKHAFTVSDAQNPKVDLSIHKTTGPEEISAGGFVSYFIDVINKGPDTASTVSFTDATPANTTFVSSSQDSGPTFNCTNAGLNTDCDIASLPAGTTASFTFVYQVNSGTAAGTTISNTATVTSTTSELHVEDNTTTALGTVLSGAPPRRLHARLSERHRYHCNNPWRGWRRECYFRRCRRLRHLRSNNQ